MPDAAARADRLLAEEGLSEVASRRTGGFSDAEMFFDGKTAVISDATDHRYASLDVPGTVENLRETLRKTGRVGVATVVLRARQHLALVMPVGRLLVLNTLRLDKSKGSLRGKIKRAGWDDDFFLSICSHMR